MIYLVISSLFLFLVGYFRKDLQKFILILLFIHLFLFYKIKDIFSEFSYISIIIFFSSILYAFEKRIKREEEFYPLMLLLLSSIIGILESKDIIYSFIYFEMMCLLSYILVAFEERRECLEAAFKYACFGILGSYLMIWGISYYFVGNLELFSLFFLIGLSVEMAIFPLSLWLPDAHSEARTSVSSVLSGVVISAAMIFFYKFYKLSYFYTGNLPIIFAVLGTLLPSILSVNERDPKKILANSSMINMGTSFLLLFLDPLTFFYYTIFHSISKSLSFLSLGPIIERFGRDVRRIKEGMMFSSISLAISILSLMGFPPFIGFFAKISSLIEISKESLLTSFIVLLSMTIFLYPYIRMLERLFIWDGRNWEKFSLRNISQIFLLIFLIFFSIRGVEICMSG